jgi:hypothetical protein
MRAAVLVGFCLLSASLVAATDYQGQFDAWKAKYAKAYASVDEYVAEKLRVEEFVSLCRQRLLSHARVFVGIVAHLCVFERGIYSV